MVINFVCRASKAGREGLSPLELSIIINGARKIITLDRRFKASSFNPKTQKVRNNKEGNEYIEAIRAKVYTLETEMIKRGIEVTMDTFIDVFKNGFKSNVVTLLQLFKEHNKLLEKQIAAGQLSASSLDKYNGTAKYITCYLKKQYKKSDILVKDITPSFIDGFFAYLLGYMANNSAIQKMKRLKKILRLAQEEGYISSNPFKTKLKKEQKDVTPLTKAEINAIRSKEIGIERLERVRDLFIFECYTGLAFTDMIKLSESNFTTDSEGNEWIVKSRQKTKVLSTIPLLPVAKEILLKYKDKLPALTNQKYNAYLKELGDICGIDKSLHSHLARHTFATVMLNSGVDLLSVSKMLGHSTSRVTEKVYVKVLPQTIMDKVKKIEPFLE